jgi:hypothetical protein
MVGQSLDHFDNEFYSTDQSRGLLPIAQEMSGYRSPGKGYYLARKNGRKDRLKLENERSL